MKSFCFKIHALKPIKRVLLLLFAVVSLSAQANESDQLNAFALGVALGKPTGITSRYELRDMKSITAFVGWQDHHLDFHVDYLIHKLGLFKMDSEEMEVYFGGGLKYYNVTTGSDIEDRLGLRGPVGLRIEMEDPDLEIFIEAALLLVASPEFKVDGNFQIGMRFLFF